MPTTLRQREIHREDIDRATPEQELADAAEKLATIRRVCEAAGIRVANASTVECVKLLARQLEARSAMVRVLEQQARQRERTTLGEDFIVEPIPGRPSAFYVGERYVADAETARRARLDLEAAAAGDVR